MPQPLIESEQGNVGGKNYVYESDGPKMGRTVNGSLIADSEETDYAVGKNPDERRNQHGEHDRNEHGLLGSGPHPVHATRTVILPRKSRECGLEGAARKIDVHLNPLPHRE